MLTVRLGLAFFIGQRRVMIMKAMNSEIKKVVTKVKEAQVQLQSLVKDYDWVGEARKYAERQGKEMKKLFAPDVRKMKDFLERERKELERFQKQIPGEVKKIQKFVNLQKKELEKVLANVRKMSQAGSKGSKGGAKKTKSTKKAGTTGTKKKASTAAATHETSASSSA